MSELAEIKERVKKLNARATKMKMDLHDLSEELPLGWERVMEVAGETHSAFKALAEARAQLKEAERKETPA
ncbi:MAG: hypothetical protein HQL33_02060 [Alphaproteobacteria bacterium]|nr:hypothetical protein [Alphaproteobacteria bacterium]